MPCLLETCLLAWACLLTCCLLGRACLLGTCLLAWACLLACCLVTHLLAGCQAANAMLTRLEALAWDLLTCCLLACLLAACLLSYRLVCFWDDPVNQSSGGYNHD
jgi:hypothetical protein